MNATNPKKCPVCHVLLRTVAVTSDTGIDVCAKCRGVWFDHNELEAVSLKEKPDLLLDAVPHSPADPIYCSFCGALNSRSVAICKQCAHALPFLCPACRLQLEEVEVAQVHADRCRNCRGVWLDGGEMNALFENYKKFKAERRGGSVSGESAADTVAAITLDSLFWAPELVLYSADALGRAASLLPGAIDSALDHVGDIPKIAAGMADGAAEVAGNVVDVSGEMIGGAIHAAGQLPEIAGSAVEAATSIVEHLIELIASIFD